MEGCNCLRDLQWMQPRQEPQSQDSSIWSKTDMDSVKQNLCLPPDQKMARPKEVANDKKNSIWYRNHFLDLFIVKKATYTVVP